MKQLLNIFFFVIQDIQCFFSRYNLCGDCYTTIGPPFQWSALVSFSFLFWISHYLISLLCSARIIKLVHAFFFLLLNLFTSSITHYLPFSLFLTLSLLVLSVIVLRVFISVVRSSYFVLLVSDPVSAVFIRTTLTVVFRCLLYFRGLGIFVSRWCPLGFPICVLLILSVFWLLCTGYVR